MSCTYLLADLAIFKHLNKRVDLKINFISAKILLSQPLTLTKVCTTRFNFK